MNQSIHLILGVVVAIFIATQSFSLDMSSVQTKLVDNQENADEKSPSDDSSTQSVSEAVSSSSQVNLDFPPSLKSDNSEEKPEAFLETIVNSSVEFVATTFQKIIQGVISPNAP